MGELIYLVSNNCYYYCSILINKIYCLFNFLLLPRLASQMSASERDKLSLFSIVSIRLVTPCVYTVDFRSCPSIKWSKKDCFPYQTTLLLLFEYSAF